MLNGQTSANRTVSERAPTTNGKTKRGRPVGRPWLRQIPDRDGKIAFLEIPERVRVVRWIVAEYVKGYGDYAISQRIAGRYRPFGKSKRWHPNAIRRILTDPAVLGTDLFPAIIGRDQFNRAQQIRLTRDVTKSARKGKIATTNMLSGLAFCAYCFSRMTYHDKGPKKKPVLVCSAGSRGYGCGIAKAWPYSHLEKIVLRVVELHLSELMGTNRYHETDVTKIIGDVEAERDKVRQQIDRFLKLTAIIRSLPQVAKHLAPLQQRLKEFDGFLRQKGRRLADMERQDSAFNRQEGELKEAISKLQTEDRRRLFEARSEVSARLKRAVKNVFVAVAGAKLSDHDDEDEFDGEPELLIVSKGGSQLHLPANMKDPFDVSHWGLSESDDSGEVFPDF